MNMFKPALLAAALLGTWMWPAEAPAHGRHHHHHGRASVGIWFGVPGPVFYPPYHYYPRYYYPPTVIVPAPAAPPVYIEQPQVSAPASGDAHFWYYCRDTRTYYPYVQTCASPWQPVVPNSAPPS